MVKIKFKVSPVCSEVKQLIAISGEMAVELHLDKYYMVSS